MITPYTCPQERWDWAGARKNELTTQRGTFINKSTNDAGEDDE